jgi:CHAT domain-containing protein
MTVFLLLSLAFALSSCRRCAKPQAIFERAEMQMKHGELQAALREVERTLECFPSADSEWHWRFRILKSEILWRQGSSRESLTLLQAEPPISFAATDLPIRRKLAMATANAFMQRLPEADRLLAEAEVSAKAGHPELLGGIAVRRGTVRFLAGDMEGAGIAYQEALQRAREAQDLFLEASALQGLGVVATRKEHYDEAIDWDRSALETARSVGAQWTLADILGNIAWCYRKLGDYDLALTFYNQAEGASVRSGAIGDQLYWLTGIESVYSEQQHYTAAEAVLEQALEKARHQDDKSALVVFLNDLSVVALETGRIDLAEKLQKEASDVEAASPHQSEILDSILIRGRMAERKGDYASAEGSFERVLSDANAESSQRWEARARLASVYAGESQNAKAEREFHKSLDAIEAVRTSVQAEELRLSFLSTAISIYNDYIEFLIRHGRVLDALQVAELSRARTLAEGLGTRPNAISLPLRDFHPQKLADRLNATLLFYWMGEERSYLWAITPAKALCLPLPKQAEIDTAVRDYRQMILDGRDVLSENSDAGKKLYQLLIAPADQLLPRNGRVIVLPAAGLYGLNFETLIVAKPVPHFWIEDVTLSEASSLALLSAASQKTGRKEKSLLLVGNPEAADPDFPALPQAAAEIQKVSTHFPEPQRKVLEGRQATASAYLDSNPERFSYLHFVTHGTASQTRPLESAVILTRDGDSYKLYARDILTHRLKADLVTISACNGAGTRAYVGEGLVGLSWAFLRAGAHNVIAALWEVSDASSTAQLMDALYADLDRGADPATALRKAKLFILNSNSNTVFHKPFYWAPFQLYAGS